MRFSPEYKNPAHRKKVDTLVSKVVAEGGVDRDFSQESSLRKRETPEDEVARGLFALLPWSVSPEDKATIKNLITYIARRHVHGVARELSPRSYQRYMSKGFTDQRIDGMRVMLEEADFSVQHELPHYLIAWLINTRQGVNENSTTPTYIDEWRDNKTVLDQDGVRRDFLEEAYAQIIDFDETHSLVTELREMQKNHHSFEDCITELAHHWFRIERDGIDRFEPEVGGTKSEADEALSQERFLEVVTASPEEREDLKEHYPLEVFLYEACFAVYYELAKNPRALWEVYQKNFQRLFEKANARAALDAQERKENN